MSKKEDLEIEILELEKAKLVRENSADEKKPRLLKIWNEFQGGMNILLAGLGFFVGFMQKTDELRKANDDLAASKSELTTTQTQRDKAQSDLDTINQEKNRVAENLNGIKAEKTKFENELASVKADLEKQKETLDSRKESLELQATNVNKLNDDLKTKQKQLELLSQKIQTLTTTTSSDPANPAMKIANEIKPAKLRILIDVTQNSAQTLPSPLNRYALSLGSVGPRNAETIVVVKLPADVQTPSSDYIQALAKSTTTANIVNQWAKLRTGDRKEITLDEKIFTMTSIITARSGKDAVQFTFEEQ